MSEAAPGLIEYCFAEDWQTISATVMSQIRHLPSFQVVWVSLSGLYPSVLDKLDGSFTARNFASTSAHFIRSFDSDLLLYGTF